MGNSMSYKCLDLQNSLIKLFLHDGTTRTLKGKRLAGEIMFEFPECMVCHADSFFIGNPVPSLAFDSRLIKGETYFVLPLDCFPLSRPLSASALAAFAASASKGGRVSLKNNQPFEYVKGLDGKVKIKVSKEFIVKIVSREVNCEEKLEKSSNRGVLCSTPELKKQYDDLVGSKEQMWSPKLDTISEAAGRLSPWRKLDTISDAAGRLSPWRLIALEPKGVGIKTLKGKISGRS